MEYYKIGLIPGPVSVPENIRRAWSINYGSSDLEEEFFTLYRQNQTLTQKLLHTRNDIVITSGEAMSILWAALKCTLKPGEKILAVSSGLFGEGFADMARAFGVVAEVCSFPYDDVPDPTKSAITQNVSAPKSLPLCTVRLLPGLSLPALRNSAVLRVKLVRCSSWISCPVREVLRSTLMLAE